MANNHLIVTGIGTDVGKTVVSAVICMALKAKYWKPIQAGDLENSDSMKIRSLSNGEIQTFEEAYRLSKPMSPHAAAEIDNVKIDLNKIAIPETDGNLIIEAAGGLMVPLNENDLYIDWIQTTMLPVILVSRHYVGSINHTLLSVDALKSRNIPIHGIIFIGDENPSSENLILNKTGLINLGRISLSETIDYNFLKSSVKDLRL